MGPTDMCVEIGINVLAPNSVTIEFLISKENILELTSNKILDGILNRITTDGLISLLSQEGLNTATVSICEDEDDEDDRIYEAKEFSLFYTKDGFDEDYEVELVIFKYYLENVLNLFKRKLEKRIRDFRKNK